VVTYPYPVYDH